MQSVTEYYFGYAETSRRAKRKREKEKQNESLPQSTAVVDRLLIIYSFIFVLVLSFETRHLRNNFMFNETVRRLHEALFQSNELNTKLFHLQREN